MALVDQTVCTERAEAPFRVAQRAFTSLTPHQKPQSEEYCRNGTSLHFVTATLPSVVGIATGLGAYQGPRHPNDIAGQLPVCAHKVRLHSANRDLSDLCCVVSGSVSSGKIRSMATGFISN